MRTFDPIKLDNTFPEASVYGQCDCCGNGTNEDGAHNTIFRVEIVGTLNAEYVCRACYEQSRERRFHIWMLNGEDILTSDIHTLDEAMREVARYLDEPDEYGRYAPFRIEASSDFGIDPEHVATIDMATADKVRSRKLHNDGAE